MSHVCVFSKCLAKLCSFSTPKNAKHVGNSDRNETCQCAERMSCVFPLTTCEMTLSLMASSLEKLSHIVSSQVMLMLQKRCLENPWNLFDVLFQCVCECCFALEQFWRCGVQIIHRSFVGWAGYIKLRIPTTSVVLPGASASAPRRLPRKPTAARGLSGEKAPEAGRRWTRPHSTATSRLQSFCSPKVPRWTPRTTLARASIREGARHRVSLSWGASKKCSDQWSQVAC